MWHLRWAGGGEHGDVTAADAGPSLPRLVRSQISVTPWLTRGNSHLLSCSDLYLILRVTLITVTLRWSFPLNSTSPPHLLNSRQVGIDRNSTGKGHCALLVQTECFIFSLPSRKLLNSESRLPVVGVPLKCGVTASAQDGQKNTLHNGLTSPKLRNRVQ